MDPLAINDLRLSGERVELVPVRPGHAARLFPRIHGREPILRWLIWEGPRTLAELEEAYAVWRSPGEAGVGLHLAVVERAIDAVVGTIALRFRGTSGVGDVGYWLAEEAWGRGLGREAVALVAWLAFEQLGVNGLCAWVDVGNQASRRVLEHSGFRLEVTVPERMEKRGRPVDQWGFALDADTWRAASAGRPAPDLELSRAD